MVYLSCPTLELNGVIRASNGFEKLDMMSTATQAIMWTDPQNNLEEIGEASPSLKPLSKKYHFQKAIIAVAKTASLLKINDSIHISLL